MNLQHGLEQIFIALDQLLNVLLAPFSAETWADETMSSRCGRLAHRYPYKFYRVVIDIIFYWQSWSMGHCVRAYESETNRYQCPPEMRLKDQNDSNSTN